MGGGADHSPVSVTSDPRLGLGSSASDTDTATEKGSVYRSESEQKSSIKTCIFCGSVWGGEITSVPTTLELGSSAFKLFPRIISLGCSGPVVVRTEFKVLSSTDGCSRLLTTYLGSQASGTSSVTRCELRGSSDVNCKSCNSCAECPLVEGQSYSDTFRTNVPGCRGVLGTGKIEPAVVTIVMNPDTKIQLNKFDVRRRALWRCPLKQRDFVFDPATQMGVGIDPGFTQAVSQAASGVWDPKTGQLLADQLRPWKLTKGQVKHASGLNNARRATERWLAPIKPHLQHLAAASAAGTSLVANLKHITVTLATWDAVWEVYLDPKWAQQRLRLYGAQDRALEQFFKKLEKEMAELSMKRHGCAKQLVVFFIAASIGTGGGWGADAVLRACCKVVCRPRGTNQRRGRVVLVDEHRTTRVSSAMNGKQPCEVELDKLSATRPAGWKPPAGQVEPRLVRPAWSKERGQPVRGLMWCPIVPPRKPPQAPRSSQEATQPAASEPGPSSPLPAKRSKRTKAEQPAEPTQPTKDKGTGKGKAAKAKPAPQLGKWLDRDCNAALNMQRIGESRWRPLELCWWPEQGKLPAKGKEYPGLGYKRVRDKPPKAQQQPAVAQ
ncbi:hypothetical protein QJQ45_000815 [Haematococcus lacustris]|nr:hypothetical protein QJQ45_000815 [Haematococcus lacustris]